MTAAPGARMIIGMGNPLRRDDGIGVRVAERLAALAPTGVDVHIHAGGGPELMERWHGAERVVLVDAVTAGGAPGAVHRFDVSGRPLPAQVRAACSTHDLGLHDVVELARALRRLPDRLIVIGVEGTDFAPGMALSLPVRAAVARAVAAVLEELGGAVTKRSA